MEECNPKGMGLLLFIVLSLFLSARSLADKGYTLYSYPPNAVDKTEVPTEPGMAMIGGGDDCLAAFSWMITHANGGDLVILRASGDDYYNSVFYNLSLSLNQTLNSVATIVFHDRSPSYDPAVLDIVKNAEAVFFSGGDQGKYVSYWAGTPLQRLLQSKLATVTMGGTSAGLAIQGNWIYTASNGSVYSDESLENPYNRFVTFSDAFLHVPFLQSVITDTHFGARDRMGRLTAFMARISTDYLHGEGSIHGVALDEQTALLLDITNGQVSAVGPNYAYICSPTRAPTVCAPNTNLAYEGIQCTRLSGVAGEVYSFSTWSGQGVLYTNNVQQGKFVSSPYGPNPPIYQS